MSKQTTKSKAINRPTRTKTAGRRDILTLDVPEGMVARWVNDNQGGRNIADMQYFGWEFLTDKGATVGDKNTDSNREAGEVISRQVDRDGTIAYAMVIDKDLYDSYQQDKQDEIDEKERAMEEELHKDGHYGEFSSKVYYG